MNILINIILILIIATIAFLLWKKHAAYQKLEDEKKEAVKVIQEIRKHRVLYTRHAHFQIIQHHIDKVLYPNRRQEYAS